MVSTSALTWAAARSGEPDWKFLGSLTPTDHAKIEVAYQEWRRRVAAGEKRPVVDWKTINLPAGMAEPVTKVVAAEAVPAAPSTVDHTGDEDVAPDTAPWEDEPDVADAVAQMEDILSEPISETDYISLDDFNLEPSEDEMKAMLQSAGSDQFNIEEASEEKAEELLEDDAEEATVDAPEAVAKDDAEETAAEGVPDQPTPVAITEADEQEDENVPIEQRISKLAKDESPAVYEDILRCLGNDVTIAKDVVVAVIRDHTRRHRGTAAQRQFLEWLEAKNK